MSGLEPLVALGLACNILQLIEVGCNTIKLAKTIYQSNSPAIDKTLQDNAAVLSTISGEVKAAPRSKNLSKLDQRLIDTADKCSVAARDLEEETNFLLRNAKQKQLAATLKIVAKTAWRKRRLDRLRESLENAEKLMMKTLLAHIWSRTRTAELDVSSVKDDLRTFIQQYQSGSRDIKQLISRESVITRDHITSSSHKTLEAIDGVQKQVTRLTLDADKQVDQAQRERLLRSLKFPAFNERRNQLFEAHEGTFECIFIGDDGPMQVDLDESELVDSDWDDSDLEDLDLEDPSGVRWDLFSNWLRSTDEIYWISGKPGCGKTSLVKYVLGHPRTIACLNIWSPQALIISHYFWRPGNAMQQNIKGLLCSLLYQLLDRNLAAVKHVLQGIQTRGLGTKDTDTDWSVPELRSIFRQVLSSYECAVCIFIDGLDEIHPSDGPSELLDLILKFPLWGDAKLCLSSRPEPVLEQRLSDYPHLRVQDLTRTDLERYAQHHMKLAPSVFDEALREWSTDKRDPIQLLVDKAEGVFLWLILATKSINKGSRYGDTAAMIRQRIDSLPGDLTKLYQDMWNRVCEDSPKAYRQTAALYFRLMLLNQDYSNIAVGFESSLLHLTLASTSLADRLLEAIDAPSTIVTEERLLKACRAVERKLNTYCFGLIEIKASFEDDSVMGWYGSQYNTLWSRYGRRRLHFIHRTARDFLLDTMDGAQILSNNSPSKVSICFAWVRAHLAISQLFAANGLRGGATSDVTGYILLLDRIPIGVTCTGHPDRSKTIFYLEKLCNSGQLLSGLGDNKCLCRGVDFLKVSARIQDEYTLPRPSLSTFSKATISEILLDVVKWSSPGIRHMEIRHMEIRHKHEVPRKGSAGPLIMMLLSEGADPNWRSHTSGTEGVRSYRYHNVRTPFTEFLDAMMLQVCLKERIAFWLKNLYGFLSHSANLDDTIYRALRYRVSTTGVYEANWTHSVGWALSHMCVQYPSSSQGDLVVAFPTCILVKALLEELDAGLEHSCGQDSVYGEMVSLLARCREYLDNWSKRKDGHVVGMLTHEEVEVPDQEYSILESFWQVPMEGQPVGAAKKLIRELEKYLLYPVDLVNPHASSGRTMAHLTQQLCWCPRAKGHGEIVESLSELGILTSCDYEHGDIQYWVDKFQERLFTERKTVD